MYDVTKTGGRRFRGWKINFIGGVRNSNIDSPLGRKDIYGCTLSQRCDCTPRSLYHLSRSITLTITVFRSIGRRSADLVGVSERHARIPPVVGVRPLRPCLANDSAMATRCGNSNGNPAPQLPPSGGGGLALQSAAMAPLRTNRRVAGQRRAATHHRRRGIRMRTAPAAPGGRGCYPKIQNFSDRSHS